MKRSILSLTVFLFTRTLIFGQQWATIPNSAIRYSTSNHKNDSSENQYLVMEYFKKDSDIIGVQVKYVNDFLLILRTEPKIFDYIFNVTPNMGNFSDYHLSCYDSSLKIEGKRKIVIGDISAKKEKNKYVYTLMNFNCDNFGARSCYVTIGFLLQQTKLKYSSIKNECVE